MYVSARGAYLTVFRLGIDGRLTNSCLLRREDDRFRGLKGVAREFSRHTKRCISCRKEQTGFEGQAGVAEDSSLVKLRASRSTYPDDEPIRGREQAGATRL
jgi:hypothetical protein